MPIRPDDVVSLANMCYWIAQAFGSGRKAAPAAFREVQNELYGLGQMLEMLKNSVETGILDTPSAAAGPTPVSQTSRCISRMVENCQNTVDSLKEFAIKYAPLSGVEFIEEKSGVKVRTAPSNSKQKLKRQWRRIMWTTEASTIQGIRDQISIHVQSITAVVTLVNTHATNELKADIRALRKQGEANQLDLKAARADIYHIHMGVSMATSNHQYVSSDLRMVQQDVQSLNHRLETIIAWQQRDMHMTSDAFKKEISHLLVKMEQLERAPQFAQPAANQLPYPTHDGHIAMPTPYADLHVSPDMPMPRLTGYHQSGRSGTAPAEMYTGYRAAAMVLSTPQELPGSQPTHRTRAASFSNETPSGYVVQSQFGRSDVSSQKSLPISRNNPLSLQQGKQQVLPERGSRETATDVVFELCVQERSPNGEIKFTSVCAHACLHGNWIKAVENGQHNEGLFACLCEPYNFEDEDFEPHAQDLEKYILTSGTIGCHFHGDVQWLLHNVGDQVGKTPVTLGVRGLGIQKGVQFERTFVEPISFKTAKATLGGGIGSFFAYKVLDNSSGDGDEVNILNSMVDNSFTADLDTLKFTLSRDRQTLKLKVKHINILHYKSISVNEIEHNQTSKRDSFKYLEYVEILVGFTPAAENEDQASYLKMHLNETDLESNDSQDNYMVRLSISRGNATFPYRYPQVEKLSGYVEFSFGSSGATNNFLQRVKDMRIELHMLRIQHPKKNEHVMVKLFADYIAAAVDNITMSGVEIAVLWDEKKRRGRFLARSQGVHRYLSQDLHLDFFKGFAELSREDLFVGSAEIYQPMQSDQVTRYPSGVGRIQFQDSSVADIFYARLTESARRFGFSMAEPKPTVESPKRRGKDPHQKPILQRRVTQIEQTKKWHFSEEHYGRGVTETAAIEEVVAPPEMMAALPKQNLSRPLDAEELLDLLNQTEEKLIYAMEGPDDFTPLAPSQPSEWTSEDLTVRKRDRKKASLNRGGARDEPSSDYRSMGSPSDATPGKFGSHTAPQTAQTTPGILSPQSEVKLQLRRTASFDYGQSERRLESEKVLIPPEVWDKHGSGIHLRGVNPPQNHRSQSTRNPSHRPGASSTLDRNTRAPLDVNTAPGETISGVDDLVVSPESYQETQSDLATPLAAAAKSAADAPSENVTSPENETRKKYENVEGSGTSEGLADSIDPFAADLGLKFRVMAAQSFIRAYWLIVDVNDVLIGGTLVWVDESAPKLFEDGAPLIRVTRFSGEPSAWVSKSILKPGRYYAMKEKQRLIADGDTVKLARDQIVVPLSDVEESGLQGLELKVVPLDRKWSVVVERDWLREVNLTNPLPD
ncbi:hypothetical protein DRE_02240 [Drechslerella stenobrocha 248]|uniref:Fungal N-terminal domain-containing protein n=1 Tax=Drechslerella stenobrocha 248 TaxID=1043628 RepID=W7HWF9_9PEZI|nr:hypothetical protein DRE_02240 [Drechslerella stenobrocha 248]